MSWNSKKKKWSRETAKEPGWSLASVGPGLSALFVAAIALISGIIVAGITGFFNLGLEREKLKSSLIRKSVETRDKEDAAKMLSFLVNLGLLERTSAIEGYEKNPEGIPLRPRGTGPPETSLYNLSPSITVNPDGRWEVIVPAVEEGVTLKTDNGEEFRVSAGDQIEIIASGLVDIGRGSVGPNGEARYTDSSMDSPFKDRVGGLEMWIGNDKNSNRYFVGARFLQKVRHTGIPTLRVIESLYGYHGGNLGAFRVVIRKSSKR